ncbi:MAG: serine/threonine-protein kinase, partial [Mastigocoleus sp. MO_167.B18]|nr:serine/threonine-protein kinase [Mastigocoleus sp. MO_167.B18]
MNTKLLNNRYQVIEVLGAGGFGETFLAEDTYMPSRRRCVIKKLKTITGDPRTYEKIKQRFEREAATLELLGEGSDQIPKLYAYFSEQELFYLVQEWIQGQTLTEIIEAKGALSETEVKSILLNLLFVLDYVHSKNIIHRDIKPDNVILSANTGKPVLIDFGAVKETIRTIANPPGRFTESLIIGTPGYMPSEQAIGRPIYATDIYSLGLTAIFLLTGKCPQELQTDRQTGEIRWQEYAAGVSPQLAQILNQAIQLQAGDRFTTASKMLDALKSESTSIPSTIKVKSQQPVTQKTIALAPNAGRSNQPIQKSKPLSNPTNNLVAPVSSILTSEVWQKPPVIIGSLILGSLLGAIAISSFA